MNARSPWTALGAISLAALGFVAGAAGSAWQTRNQRAEPWREIKLEHRGAEGEPTRTRLVFENPKLALASVELQRGDNGHPELARVELRAGDELTARYEEEDSRPASLQGADGAMARFGYKGGKMRVVFLTADGKEVGNKVVEVPVGLVSALKLAQLDTQLETAPGQGVLAWLWREVVIGEAWAKEDDEQIAVQREVSMLLDVKVKSSKDESGNAQVEADCPPFTCLPVSATTPMPGANKVRVNVTAATKKSALEAPQGKALEAFRKKASDERGTARRVLPDVTALVAVVGVTAVACRSLKLNLSVCASGFSKAAASAAVHGISSYEIPTQGRELDPRALELYYEDQAREALDAKTKISVCVSRDGFARVCADVEGRPFGDEPMPEAKGSVEMRRGIGGALAGSFELAQSDGQDCKFSPSPRTSGKLSLSFDNEKGIVTGALKADERGTRNSLRCSLGNASMRWSQSYTINVSQTFTKEQLQGGGKLTLRLTGTMKGTGTYSFNSCSSAGGSPANCPGGKTEPYSYPIELVGELDLDKQTGSGRLVVSGAPLNTRGNWRIPAAP